MVAILYHALQFAFYAAGTAYYATALVMLIADRLKNSESSNLSESAQVYTTG